MDILSWTLMRADRRVLRGIEEFLWVNQLLGDIQQALLRNLA